MEPGEVRDADFILGSYNHGDHIDIPCLPAMLNASPNCRLVIPKAVVSELNLASDFQSRITAMNDGETRDFGDVKSPRIKAAHELLNPDADGNYPCLSHGHEIGGKALFFSGDACVC